MTFDDLKATGNGRNIYLTNRAQILKEDLASGALTQGQYDEACASLLEMQSVGGKLVRPKNSIPTQEVDIVADYLSKVITDQ